MTIHALSLHDLPDDQLLERVKTLASRERRATADLIASLAEIDKRRLYRPQGYPSLFAYCTECLHLSEHAAYLRIEAARAAREFPLVLDLLIDGSITLTTVSLLKRHLTAENHQRVLKEAVHKSRRDVEAQVAALSPKPDAPSIVRKVTTQGSMGSKRSRDSAESAFALSVPLAADEPPSPQREQPLVPRPAPVVTPLAPERFKLQMTIGRETHDKLRRVQDLMRHVNPTGDAAIIFDRALTLLLEDLERRKIAATDRPRTARAANSGSRHIPASVKREVWARDGGQCTFVGVDRRCAERGFLEFHHVQPFAQGGATTAANLQLRCRAHNAYEAEVAFGSFLVREWGIDYVIEPTRFEPS